MQTYYTDHLFGDHFGHGHVTEVVKLSDAQKEIAKREEEIKEIKKSRETAWERGDKDGQTILRLTADIARYREALKELRSLAKSVLKDKAKGDDVKIDENYILKLTQETMEAEHG